MSDKGLSGEEAANALPSGLTDVQLGEQKGLLSALGDPVGKALNAGLSPVVGNAIGGLTNGGYGKAKEMDKAEKAEEEKRSQFGGKEKTGENPLGL